MNFSKPIIAIVSFMFVFLFGVTSAQATQQITKSISMPQQLLGRVSTLDCSNSPGPQVTLDGSLTMNGLTGRFIFRNNINKDVHVHEEEVTMDVAVISPGEEIVIPKQPVHGGTGGNPFIWIQLLDNSNDPLSDEIFLGRCVQGLFEPTADFASMVSASALVTVDNCENSPGPFIRMDGSLSFDRGVKARFIFRNNDNPVGGPHEADAVRDVSLIGTGHMIEFPKQPVQGGVGGNPWISFQFLNGDGAPLSSEVLLGRCVQLSK